MAAFAPPTAPPARGLVPAYRVRMAFLGPPDWLESCCPPAAYGLHGPHGSRRIAILEGSDLDATMAEVIRFGPQVTVVFDPLCLPTEALRILPGVTVGVITAKLDRGSRAMLSRAASALDRVVSFQPVFSGTSLGTTEIWRAVPPPVNDAYFGEVRPLHNRPRAMSVGRSTEYREHILMPAKHHHDLLQVIHGVGGETMIELLRDYDVGIYSPAESGGGFGPQVGIHLAAGQLLLAHRLRPAHGLEQGIDYLGFDSPQELVWILDRLSRFPEMYQRVRVRGRMKAERYRGTHLLARLAHDLLAHVAAFGSARR